MKSGPGSVAMRARTPTHTVGVVKTVAFPDRVVGGTRVSVCTPDTVAWARTKGWPVKRLAWSLAKKTSSATVPPPCVLSRSAPAVTATESTLHGPKRDGSVNGRDTVRSVCPTPPGRSKENASRLSGRRKPSTSTVRTMWDAAHAASATANHKLPSAAARFIRPPRPCWLSGQAAWWNSNLPIWYTVGPLKQSVDVARLRERCLVSIATSRRDLLREVDPGDAWAQRGCVRPAEHPRDALTRGSPAAEGNPAC